MRDPSLSQPARFAFVDGFRGIGCAIVVLAHLAPLYREYCGPLGSTVDAIVPVVGFLARRAVEVFFILSGFVIAYSIRDYRLSARSIASFVLRRQVRLDPVYWLCLSLAAIDLYVRRPAGVPLPTVSSMVAEVLYLPWLLRHRPLIAVSWTLCLELQFYLVFILLVGAAQWLEGRSTRQWSAFLVATLGLLSLVFRLKHSDNNHPLFLGSWFLFGEGVMTYWALIGRGSRWVTLGFVVVVSVIAVPSDQLDVIFGAAAAWVLYAVGKTGHLGNWLSHRTLQYLGRRSYTVYVVHVLVMSWVFEVGRHLTGLAPPRAFLWSLAAGAAAFLFADLVHRYLERPTMRLASRFQPAKLEAPVVAQVELQRQAG